MPKRSVASFEIERLEISDEIADKTIYEPLPAGEFIRVLKLQPGDNNQDIKCNLEIVDIEQSKGSYEALSYVWGDANNTVDVQCNGQRVPITVSLANALRNFRHTSEPRVLWADALCINQKDDHEKGHQVKRMGEVYANAKCTLVWLGRDDQDIAEDVFALILDANAYFADSFLRANQTTFRMAYFTKPYPISMDEEIWSGIATLFRFPWFRRVWAIQEVAVAKECRMFWGTVSINIADVFELSMWIHAKSDFRGIIWGIVGQFTIPPLNHIVLYFYYNIHQPERWQQSRSGLADRATQLKEMPFWALLMESRSLEASDPRDRVYAFLGCPAAIDSKGRTFVETDYTSSIDDLNLRLAYALIKHASEGPFLLSTVCHNTRDRLLDGMHPSWLPVWHVAGVDRPKIADPSYWFQAGGDRELFTATKCDENRLSIGACAFDTVIWRSSKMQRDHMGVEPTCVLTSGLDEVFIDTLWDDVMQNSSRIGIAVRHADFFRSLVMGYPYNSGFSAICEERQQGIIDAYRKSIRVARPSHQEAVMEVDERQDAISVKQSLYNIHNASMFLTRDGRIGIAPLGHLVEVGDVCCIIFGATVPFLLTPVREGRHKLISECYINGVMNGEIMQHFAGSDLSKHQIVLE